MYKHKNMRKDAPKDKNIDVNGWLKKSSIAVSNVTPRWHHSWGVLLHNMWWDGKAPPSPFTASFII